jgi:hypothetical protein
MWILNCELNKGRGAEWGSTGSSVMYISVPCNIRQVEFWTCSFSEYWSNSFDLNFRDSLGLCIFKSLFNIPTLSFLCVCLWVGGTNFLIALASVSNVFQMLTTRSIVKCRHCENS